jgi:hypothetical protein
VLRAGTSRQSAFYALLLSIGLIVPASGQKLHSATSRQVNQAGSAILDPALSYSTYLGFPGQLASQFAFLNGALAANAAGNVCSFLGGAAYRT